MTILRRGADAFMAKPPLPATLGNPPFFRTSRAAADTSWAMFGKGPQDDLLAEIERLRRRVAELESERTRLRGVDELTGALNARALRSRLVDEVSRTRRTRRPLALAMLVVDDFMAIEAAHGFASGDELLTITVQRIMNSVRRHDVVGRTGVHEFGILLPETTSEDALVVMARILSALEQAGTGAMSAAHASAGVADWRGTSSPEGLMAAAREAAAQAQRMGGQQDLGQPEIFTMVQAKSPQQDAVEALALTLMERDRYTGEHSEAVIEMSAGVARTLGLRETEVQWIRSAALLHDIGKVAIPDEILHKPGPLSDEEWVLMKQHPVIGERILRVLPGMGPVARIVRHEHERWDGNGYPDGLAGEEIPIGSRIIIAADTYHAITSDRPYRAARSHREAIEELTLCSGTQFDPAVTGALIGYLYGQRQTGAVAAAS
jgi:diguanylate cyclase (GGDEF)-like protein/putative nucleotidyltransferase with HDIG domain